MKVNQKNEAMYCTYINLSDYNDFIETIFPSWFKLIGLLRQEEEKFPETIKYEAR